MIPLTLAFVTFITNNPGFAAWLIGGLFAVIAALIASYWTMIHSRLIKLEETDSHLVDEVEELRGKGERLRRGDLSLDDMEKNLRRRLRDWKKRQEKLDGTAARPAGSAAGEAAFLDWEISAKGGKATFMDELRLPESSTAEHPKTGEPLGNLSPAAESPAGHRPSREIRLESAPALPHLSKGGVPEQVSQKVVWSLGRHEESFRLTLDPPHLGSIYMEIQREKEQVKATLWTENPDTKQILESSQHSIQKIIETEGFSLETFDVFVEQDLGAFQESRERMPSPSETATSGSKDEVKGELSVEPSAPARFALRGGGALRSINLII